MNMALLIRIWNSFDIMGISHRTFIILMFVSIFAAIFEGIGIGVLLPIFSLIETGASENIQMPDGPLLVIKKFLNTFHIPLSFGALILFAAISMILRQSFFFIKQLIIAHVIQDSGKALRRLVSRIVFQADIKFFIDNGHGKFLHSIMIEPMNAATLISTTSMILMNTGQLLIYGLIMLFLSWKLAFIAGPIVVIAWLALRYFVKSAGLAAFSAKEALGHMNESVSEYIRGIQFIKLRAYENDAAEDIGLNIDLAGNLTKKYDIIRAFSNSIAPMIIMIGSFGLLYIAVNNMHISLSELGVFMVIAMRAQQMIIQINADRLIMSRQLVSFTHVENFVAMAEAAKTIKNGHLPFSHQKSIRFSDVAFSYSRNRDSTVLNKINMTIPHGQTIAIVGPSGAGKSTLVDLLLRNFDQTQGEILFDGVSHKELLIRDLRLNIAMVPQDTFLFHNSIRNNLVFGLNSLPDDDEIKAALLKAHALDFVMALPDGLDTHLGEGGADLSGGQRQRLALARALIQNPCILVLDEPTSALDSETEAIFQKTLNQLKGELTIIIIAHRLSTIQDADQIFVLNKGNIEATGSHEELMNSSPLYKKLFKL